MRRRSTQRPEDRAVRRVNDVVADDLRWNFGREPLPDYGVDALAEVVADDDLVTGRLIGLQIKGGDSYFDEPRGAEGWVFREDNDHLAYWLCHSLPILVVLVNSARQAFWQVITSRTVIEHAKGFSIMVPRSQPFDGSAQEELLALVGKREGLLEQFPRLPFGLAAGRGAAAAPRRSGRPAGGGAAGRAPGGRTRAARDDRGLGDRGMPLMACAERCGAGPMDSCGHLRKPAFVSCRGRQGIRHGRGQRGIQVRAVLSGSLAWP